MAETPQPGRGPPPDQDGMEEALQRAVPDDALDERAVLQMVRSGLGLSKANPAPPAAIGRYQLHERLGAGGGGSVYAAWDRQLQRTVAIKLVATPASDPGRPAANRRLVREARAAASIEHPNVVAVFDAGRYSADEARRVGVQASAPGVFIVMERVDGPDLARWLRDAPRPLARIVEVFRQAGLGLLAAHERGLVHRDFKPSNVLLAGDGTAKVGDFGLALPDPSVSSSDVVPHGDERLTRDGFAAGTPSYMSPEQRGARPLDARSDQFSFCVSLYEASYGQRPFGSEVRAAFRGRLRTGPTFVSKRGPVPRWLRRVLSRGLALEPRARFDSMRQLLDALQPSSGASLQVAAAAAGVAVLVGASSWPRDRSCPADSGADGIWSDAAPRAIRAAFLRTRLSHASSTAESVVEVLGRYAEAWDRTHARVCRDTPARSEERQLALACLAARRARLETLTEAFADASARELDRSMAAVTNLQAPSACLAPAESVPRAPIAKRRAVARVRETLARALAAFDVGDYLRADELSRAGASAADATAFDPLIAEAKVLRGLALRGRGRLEEASNVLAEAYWVAASAGADETAVRAASERVFIASTMLGRYDDAAVWERHARSVVASAADLRPTVHATAINASATVALARRDFEAARQRFDEARQVLQSAPSPDAVRLATVEANLGVVAQRSGRLDDALRWLGAAADRRAVALGERHPAYAETLLNVAGVHRARGEGEEARRTLLRVRAILPERHPSAALVETNLGNLDFDRERWGDASQRYRAAVAAFVATRGPRAPQVAEARARVAMALHRGGDSPAALVEYEAALDIWAAAPGPSPDRAGLHAKTLLDTAELYLDVGRPHAAARALAGFRESRARLSAPDLEALGGQAKALADRLESAPP